MRQIKTVLAFALVGLFIGPPQLRAADRAGDFDYYVLSLSWSASWCAQEGDARGADQCDPRHEYGFTLHGLWPQYEDGYPEYCRAAVADPSRRESEAMADIMGSGGLAWHQWKKHGRCTGLGAGAYYDLSRAAYERYRAPEIFRRLTATVTIAPEVVEAAFIEAHPDLTPDGVTVTCADRYLREVRICLTRALEPRACGADVARDCQGAPLMPPMR